MKNHMISVILGDVGMLAPWVTILFLTKMISHIQKRNDMIKNRIQQTGKVISVRQIRSNYVMRVESMGKIYFVPTSKQSYLKKYPVDSEISIFVARGDGIPVSILETDDISTQQEFFQKRISSASPDRLPIIADEIPSKNKIIVLGVLMLVTLSAGSFLAWYSIKLM